MFENSSSSTEEAEVFALRRKKVLLERVMKRLRELIIASQPKGIFCNFEKYESNVFIYDAILIEELNLSVIRQITIFVTFSSERGRLRLQ